MSDKEDLANLAFDVVKTEPCEVIVQPNILLYFQSLHHGDQKERKNFILADENLYHLYKESLFNKLDNLLFEVIVVSSGESSKSLDVYMRLIDELARKDMLRRSNLILMGGGVIMDLGGFVGATFMRGVPIINIPTTLLAQVDAGIGGKVAVNHKTAKNLVGAFYNPRKVVIDPAFLKTLDRAQIQEGLAEVIKVAIIYSPELFDMIESNLEGIFLLENDIILRMINLSIKAKIELLKNDPLENSLERVLNFGHTLAHPIETINKNIEISHGRAVSIGIACATRFAFAKGFCSKATLLRILDVLRNVGLPTTLDTFDYQKLYKAIEMVVKVRDGNMNLVIPQEIGRPLIIRDVSIHELIDCIV